MSATSHKTPTPCWCPRSAAGYTDKLRGIAYLVIAVPRTELRGIPKVDARVQGLKVSDPRTSPPTVAYSDNPALCLADFITDTDYGMGLTLDTTTVDAVADSNDGSIGFAIRKASAPMDRPEQNNPGLEVGVRSSPGLRQRVRLDGWRHGHLRQRPNRRVRLYVRRHEHHRGKRAMGEGRREPNPDRRRSSLAGSH